MNESPKLDREPQPQAEPPRYIRLPLPIVAGGLFVVLAGLLALGLYANRNLRPIGVLPTLTPQVVAAPTLAPPATATAVSPISTPTLVPMPLILTIDGSPTPGPSPVSANATPTVLPTPAEATTSPTPLPTVEPTLAAEVGKAYENFWRVKSQALLELDSSHLADVMSGQYLSITTNLINDLRSEGRAIKTRVRLNYTVVKASEMTATLVDYFEDNSFYVAIGSEDPLSSPAADNLSVMYGLEKFPEGWKVVQSVRSPS